MRSSPKSDGTSTKARRQTPVAALPKPAKPAARGRLSAAEREEQIVKGAISFFADRGLDGQTRDLAKLLGITHPLLFHYFPNKQNLVERVYQEVYLGRWRAEWEQWIDDRTVPLEDRLTRFYIDYAKAILTRDWVRILMFSGLKDGYIPSRYMKLVHSRLLPRIGREMRWELGLPVDEKQREAESELMWGLHGGIFHIGLRHWVYGLPMPKDMDGVVTDRVHAFMLAAPGIFRRG